MSKPDLLLLHAALGAASQFAPLVPLLRENFTVWTLDFEGHGESPAGERPLRTHHLVENVLEFMDARHLQDVDIFGYSMGGQVGLVMARNHPERVRRVFTFATKLHWTPEIAAREAGFMDPERIERKVPHFARLLAGRHKGVPWQDVMARTREMMIEQGRRQPLSENDYRQIAQPVRLSLGDRDKMVTIEETLAIYRLLPNAQLQVFPDTPHPIEQAALQPIAEAIISFFGRQTST